MVPQVYKGEAGYRALLKETLNSGVNTPDRTDVGACRKLLNQTLWFDLRESFPSSTMRPMSLRYGFEEMMMFLRGETDTTVLEEKGINFWKPQTSREFLDSRGLENLSVGDMGKAYGHQLRDFNDQWYDQLEDLILNLQRDPFSRRHVVTLYNPAQVDEGALQPCWWSWKFTVEPGDNRNVLHMTVNSRSADLLFGTPNNYQQYAFLLKALSQLLGMEAGTLVCNLDDCHIYDNQVRYVQELVNRGYFPLINYDWAVGGMNRVKIHINKELNCMKDLLQINWEDIVLEGLQVNTEPFSTPKPKMAV